MIDDEKAVDRSRCARLHMNSVGGGGETPAEQYRSDGEAERPSNHLQH
jgi:hypothetical protein